MNDPCKSCGALKCAAFEACQCCGNCRNCGQAMNMHGLTGAPFIVPQPTVVPAPVPYPGVIPWWGAERLPKVDITCAGGIPQGEWFTVEARSWMPPIGGAQHHS